MLFTFLGTLVLAIGFIDLCGIYHKRPALPDSKITRENIKKWMQIPGMQFFLWCLLISAVLIIAGFFELLA